MKYSGPSASTSFGYQFPATIVTSATAPASHSKWLRSHAKKSHLALAGALHWLHENCTFAFAFALALACGDCPLACGKCPLAFALAITILLSFESVQALAFAFVLALAFALGFAFALSFAFGERVSLSKRGYAD